MRWGSAVQPIQRLRKKVSSYTPSRLFLFPSHFLLCFFITDEYKTVNNNGEDESHSSGKRTCWRTIVQHSNPQRCEIHTYAVIHAMTGKKKGKDKTFILQRVLITLLYNSYAFLFPRSLNHNMCVFSFSSSI